MMRTPRNGSMVLCSRKMTPKETCWVDWGEKMVENRVEMLWQGFQKALGLGCFVSFWINTQENNSKERMMYFFSAPELAQSMVNVFPCARAESFMVAGGYGRGGSVLPRPTSVSSLSKLVCYQSWTCVVSFPWSVSSSCLG